MITERRVFVTSDGASFDDRHEAEEHEGDLLVREACKAIWGQADNADDVASVLTCASRERLRSLLHALEPYS